MMVGRCRRALASVTASLPSAGARWRADRGPEHFGAKHPRHLASSCHNYSMPSFRWTVQQTVPQPLETNNTQCSSSSLNLNEVLSEHCY
jgi:hypothetical protein